MEKQAELNKELVEGLKVAKSKRIYFALVLKGSNDGALILSKTKVPPTAIAEAKKESGGSVVVKGHCKYEDGKYVFETAKDAPATAPQAVKVIAKRDAGMAVHAEFRTSTDPELLSDENGSVPSTGPTASTPPTMPPLPSVPQTTDLATKFTTRLREVGPDYAKSLTVTSSTVTGSLKSQMGVVNSLYQKKEFSNALSELEKLDTSVKEALANVHPTGGKGVELTEEEETAVAEGIQSLFDEDSGPYKYRAEREKVMTSFKPAVKLLGSLQNNLDKADGLAENEDYDPGIKELGAVQAECDRVLDDGKRRWAVKQKEFFEYRKMGERLAELREKKIAALEERIEGAKQGGQTKSVAEFETQLKELQKAVDEAKPLNDLYKAAQEAAAGLDYAEAYKQIDEAAKIGLKMQENMKKVAEKVALETQNAEGEDKKTFDFASKTKDKNWGFDTDDDAKNFFIGAATNDLGGLVPSDQLKKMYTQVDGALGRLEQLLAAGMDPEKAGDVAFKNIPKNFWPDRVVREVTMYRRARATFEEEQRALLVQKETQDMIDKVLSGAGSGSDTLGSGVSTVAQQLDPTTLQGYQADLVKLKDDAAKLKIQGLNEITQKISEKGGKLLDNKKLNALGDSIQGFATDFGYASSGLGVLIKGAQAVKAGVDASKIGEDDPVKKKLMEFKRNKAILDAVNSMIDLGLGLDEICPALKIASGGKDMVQETIKAVTYFVKLAEIVDLKADAKFDPESMMDLPLARMAKNQGIRASKATVAAVVALIETTGAAVTMSGVAAGAGAGLTVAGKVLKLGGKVVFSVVNWADARKCTNTMKKAAGPPPIRKAQIVIFKNSTKYATYALAYGAVEGGDPWAIQYLVNGGLTEEDLKSPATSIEIVREYMLTTAGGIMGDADVEEDDPTILPGQRPKGFKDKAKSKAKELTVKGAKKVRDKVVGRSTDKKYDPAWKASAALTRANWQEIKKGAIAAGWYDTRSGLGDVLAAYEAAAAEFQKTPDTKTVVVVDGALIELYDALSGVGTLTQDEKTAHDGMLDYVAAMYKLVETEKSKIREQREKLFDAEKFGDLPPEELKTKKEQFMQESVEKAKQEQEEKSTARLETIRIAWQKRKHNTPYGNATFPDFVSKAAKTLDLDPEETMALAGTTISLSEECVVQLRSLLSGTPEDKFKGELERQAAQLDGSLVEELRTLAQTHFEAMKLRLASKQQETDQFGDPADDGSTWKSQNFMLSEKGWTSVKADAIKHGLVDTATGIGGALKVLNKAEAEYRKNKDDEKNVRLVNGALVKVKEVFEKFKPLNHNKFVHQGMADYRAKMLVKINEYSISLQSERASKKLTDKEKQVEAQKEQEVINQRDFKATPFTKDAWNTLKDKAIEQGLVDKSTGLAKAFEVYGKAKGAYDNETVPNKKPKAKELYVKGIDNLNGKLTSFDPKLRNKTAHPGMAYWRGQMIAELSKIKRELPA